MQGREEPPQSERDFRQARNAARGTEPLPTDADWGEPPDPVSPAWRSERTRMTGRRRSAASRLPSNRGDLMVWLQRGGWRWLALAAGLIVLLVVVFALRGGEQTTAFDQATQEAVPEEALTLPTVTLAPVEPTSVPSPAAQAFVVVGTAEQGLFLRPEPNTNNAPLKTLPEGTRVEALGEESQGSDYVWVRVRDAEGAEGWVARDFLSPAE